MSALPAAELLPLPVTGRTFTAERTVRLGDVDGAGELRLDALARYLQDVATDDALDAGVRNAMGWLVRRTLIRVERPALLNERLRLTTFCSGSGRSWAERRTRLVRGADVCADAVCLWIQIDTESGRPARLGDEFFLHWGEAAAGRVVSSRLSLPKTPPGRDADTGWQFRATDVDPFGHVNNAAQWAVVEQWLADTGRPRLGTGEVEHLAPVDAGEGLELAVDGSTGWVSGGSGVTTVWRWTPA